MSGSVSEQTPARHGRWKAFLDAVVSVSLLVASAVVVWQASAGRKPPRPEPVIPDKPLAIGDAPTEGATDAAVAIFVYSDFQCSFCKRFATQTLPSLRSRYIEKGQVLLVFRHFPQSGLHPDARGAAVASYCAGRQGQFWKIHDQFFAEPRSLGSEQRRALVRASSLDIEEWESCLAADGPAAIDRDIESAKRLRITGTPYFLIGRVFGAAVTVEKIIPGAAEEERFVGVIDRLLK